MKNLIKPGMIAFLLLIAVSVIGQQNKHKGVVDIKDVKNTQLPDRNPANHKQHDMEVYKIMGKENAYKVLFFKKENDTLKGYSATYGSKDDVDKAAYEWINDSLVSFHLYSSGSKKEINFRVSGNHGRTSLVTDN